MKEMPFPSGVPGTLHLEIPGLLTRALKSACPNPEEENDGILISSVTHRIKMPDFLCGSTTIAIWTVPSELAISLGFQRHRCLC